MSEQLWYTWSTSGFGITSAGFRVRAASRGFMDARGQVDMQSDRLLTLRKCLYYDLPQDTLDPYKVDPQQAPRSFAFVQAGQERILVNTTYKGLDGAKRAGAFFSHLLTDLPPVPSPCPGGQLPFSAREAIERWRSDFWKDSERSLDPKSLDLPQVSPSELFVGPLSLDDAVKVPEQFLYVLQAFLTLPTLGEQKRLYIAALPDTLATLIWGLTHALPRTLTVMRHLTFSTYERDIDKSSATIIGTCWFSPISQDGRSNTPRDLPASYYLEQNPYGLALNCYLPERKTPVTPDPLLIRFTQFAVNCFTQNNLTELNMLLDEAERRNINDVKEFLDLYIVWQETLTPEELMRILTALITKAKALIEGVINVLQAGKGPFSAELLVPGEPVHLDADIKRENVRRSITLLITKAPQWWQGQGRAMIGKLVQLADSYTEDALLALRTSFVQRITASREWQKDQGQTVISRLGLAGQGSVGNDPVAVLTAFAERMVSIVSGVQNELATALLPLVTSFGDQLRQAIQANDLPQTSFWANALASSTSLRSETEVWASLLGQFAGGVIYTPAYQQWWQQYGRTKVGKLRPLADRNRESTLAKAFSAFALAAATNLQVVIQQNDASTVPFWGEVLNTSAPLASEPGVWLHLLRNLWQARYTSAYQQWWTTQGKDATQSVRLLAEREPQSELAKQLSTFAIDVADELCQGIVAQAMATKPDERIAFLLDVLTATAPASESGAWPHLLHKLSMRPSAHLHVYEPFSWELRSLLLQTWASVAVLKDNQFIARDWLKVRWKELDELLLLKLPEDWYKVAITQLLIAPCDISPQEVKDLVTAHAALFEEVLQLLMSIPVGQQGALATRQEALRFFATLAEQSYPRRTHLLDGMLKASGYQQEVAEALFASVHLDTPNEVAELLEHHCEDFLEGYELPPTLLGFVRYYLANFDVDYLDSDPTRKLLQRLWQRSDLQASVEGWYKIAEFIAEPNVSRNWLRDLSHTIRNMTQLMPDARSKFATKLVPRLVEFVSREADLARVIDNLGKELVGPVTGLIGPDLLLLAQMAEIASEKYGRERPPARIALYVRMVLGEALSLPSAEKEQFVDRCFQALLKDMDPKTRDQIRIDALWPEDFLAEWKAYSSRSGLAALTTALARFRESLGKKEMFSIVRAYDPILERALTSDEKGALALAHIFVGAYQTDSDDAIVAANEAIIASPYRQLVGYTSKQKERIQAAAAAVLARFRKALHYKEMFGIVNAYHPTLERSLTPDEKQRLALARIFVEAYQTDRDDAIVAAYEAIKGSPYRQLVGYTQQQLDRIKLAQSRVSSPPSPAPAPAPVQTPAANVHPQAPPLSTSQAALMANKAVVAAAQGQGITLGWLEWVLSLKTPYTPYRISAIRQRIQQLEQGDQRDHAIKQELKFKKGEVKELEKLPDDPQQLRSIVLDELMDDVLIQEGIAEVIGRDPAQREKLDPEPDLNAILTALRMHQGSKHPQLHSTDSSIVEDIRKVLRIFRRRQLFAWYLHSEGPKPLHNWLKERRRSADISIDYERAGVKPSGKPLNLTWLSF